MGQTRARRLEPVAPAEARHAVGRSGRAGLQFGDGHTLGLVAAHAGLGGGRSGRLLGTDGHCGDSGQPDTDGAEPGSAPSVSRSEEHTSELQSLMRISYAVLSLKKKKTTTSKHTTQRKKTSKQHRQDCLTRVLPR